MKEDPGRLSRRNRALTLIEMLTGVAAIALLLALLLPTLGAARETARQVRCAGHLRQWGIATNLYLAEFDNRLPFDRHLVGTSAAADTTPGIWFNALPPFVQAPPYALYYTGDASARQYPAVNVWWCPSARATYGGRATTPSGNAFDYSMNAVLDGTGRRGPNYGSGATPDRIPHVRAASIPVPADTLLFGERSTRVESLSIGTLDTDRHRGARVNMLFLDGHANPFDAASADTVSSGSNTTGDYWKTHGDRIVWGAFN